MKNQLGCLYEYGVGIQTSLLTSVQLGWNLLIKGGAKPSAANDTPLAKKRLFLLLALFCAAPILHKKAIVGSLAENRGGGKGPIKKWTETIDKSGKTIDKSCETIYKPCFGSPWKPFLRGPSPITGTLQVASSPLDQEQSLDLGGCKSPPRGTVFTYSLTSCTELCPSWLGKACVTTCTKPLICPVSARSLRTINM